VEFEKVQENKVIKVIDNHSSVAAFTGLGRIELERQIRRA
jgi:hypothetical protein